MDRASLLGTRFIIVHLFLMHLLTVLKGL